MKDAGKYDSYSDGGLPNGPRQEPAPPRATTESERRDQLYKVWLNYNQLTGSVESRKVFDSACAILAPQGAPVAPVVEQALTRAAVLTMAWDVFNNKLHPVKMANDIAAALAQSTPHVPAGEQKRRRCNWCNELEPAASVAPVVEQAALDENRINALVMQVAYDKWSDKPTPSDYVKAGWSAALAQSTPHVPADPLQGAADWLKQAFEDCTVGDLQRNLRIGYNRASRLFSAAPHVPAGEQVAEFEQAVAACAKLHTEYMGKVMTDEVYDRFATLRDETIPRLRKALATPRAPEPAAPVAQEPVAEVSAETFNDDGTSDIITSSLPIGTKLYAAPTAAQGLSGVEIALRDLLDSYMSQMPPDEAAAILSANRAAQETK